MLIEWVFSFVCLLGPVWFVGRFLAIGKSNKPRRGKTNQRQRGAAKLKGRKP